MIHRAKKSLTDKIKFSLGWKTKKKIVVFESDDWGAIRMPSLEVYNYLSSKGLKLDSPAGYLFNRYDTLADEDDLHVLYETLNSVKDKNGNPAKFTLVSVTANPDFEKIEKNNFQQYFYEPFTKTLERYQGHNRTIDLWQEGIEKGFIRPESHSREHLNSILWMKNLQNNDPQTRMAFDQRTWAFSNHSKVGSYQVAFALTSKEDLDIQKITIQEGLRMFKEIFGFNATFFVPPNGVFHPSLEETTMDNGIDYLYSSFISTIPKIGGGVKKTIRYLGKQNQYNQSYIVRNCRFEPNQPNIDWVGMALGDISTAFKYNAPAILGPHRKNFMGGIEESNRKMGISALKELLQQVVKRWPDVEFMDSKELGLEMRKND